MVQLKYLLLITFLLNQSSGKVFTRCGLTKELIGLGFDRTLVGNWVCLIESESGKDTAKEVNKGNGGKGLGLFQINSKEYCTYKKAGGKCNIKCEDLLNEELRDDARCAKKVYNLRGFGGWNGWVRSCYRRHLPLPNSLVDDQILDDSKCAKQIFDENGFKYWSGWRRNCNRTPLVDTIINTCVKGQIS